MPRRNPVEQQPAAAAIACPRRRGGRGPRRHGRGGKTGRAARTGFPACGGPGAAASRGVPDALVTSKRSAPGGGGEAIEKPRLQPGRGKAPGSKGRTAEASPPAPRRCAPDPSPWSRDLSTSAPRLEHDLLQVAPAITVMIRKAAGAGDPHAETAQSSSNRSAGRFRRRRTPRTLQRAGSDRFAVRFTNPRASRRQWISAAPGL